MSSGYFFFLDGLRSSSTKSEAERGDVASMRRKEMVRKNLARKQNKLMRK